MDTGRKFSYRDTPKQDSRDFNGVSAGLFETRWCFALGLLLAMAMTIPGPSADAQQSGEQIFKSQCTPCHTIGEGELVGPDLEGVTLRREPEWLRRQIKEPDELIEENDPIALQLLEESNNVPMAPLGLNDAEVTAVIEYLKSTEQQSNVQSGIPSQYLPTVFVSTIVLVALTLVGLRAGTKNVEVR